MDFDQTWFFKFCKRHSDLLPKKLAHDIRYRRCHKRKMNWKNPQTLDEKLHYSMVYNIGKNEAKFADKYLVRNYIKECGCEDILIPLLLQGVYSSTKDIPYDELPDKFVLKANNGSGADFLTVCTNKADLDWEKESKKLDKAIRTDFSIDSNEYHYHYIKGKIIAEQYLYDGHDNGITDYKFFCFDGEPSLIQVISERSTGVKLNYYDIDWNPVNCIREGSYGEITSKPLSYDTMVESCRKIGKGIPFARIDFYDVNGQAYFGEITLTPAGGYVYHLSEEMQVELGKKFVLKKKHEKYTNK